MTPLRWTTTDDPCAAGTLFDDLVDRHVGRGAYQGLTFFHVEAKRLINHVPSSLPFDYTINVFRGCSHACAYCLEGDTSILMADGTQRPLRKVRPGDSVIGTSDLGRYRRYRESVVLDAWASRRPAFRLRLRNGTEVIASGDHRFLTDFGWSHVHDEGRHHRRALGFGSRLLGLETLPAPAAGDARYGLIDAAVVGGRDLVVQCIEDLGVEVPMFDLTTSTGDFVADGLVAHNCFARPTHDYLGFDIGDDFDSKIVVKINAVERVRAETEPGRWAGHQIAMGTNTDPYQPAEGKYRLTRGVVEVLTERRNPFSILTKSPLVLRDLDVLAEAASVTSAVVDFSIPTLDEQVWKLTEPRAPHPGRRIGAVRKLNEAGVPSGVLVAPVIPGLSDRPEQLQDLAAAVAGAGARFATPMYLQLRGRPIRHHWFDWLVRNRPELIRHHRAAYAGRSGAPAAAERRLAARLDQELGAHGGVRSRPPRTAGVRQPPPADQLRFDV